MSEKILFVDDEINVLAGIKRQLRKCPFLVDTATSGAEALEKIKKEGPYAVIVSDMRMPKMDGIELLSRVMEIAPDSVRMMLTGNTDQETAITAVNQGRIFRFMNKPCPTKLLRAFVEDGIRQYRLITSEKELLNSTLNGSIKIMAEILSQVNPIAFSRCMQIKQYVMHVVNRLGLRPRWEFSIAAFLSQIGCVTVPNDILEKVYAGRQLDPKEEEIFLAHPKAGAKLISKIPRLERISEMIALQTRPFCQYQAPASAREKVIHMGGQLLKIAVDLDRHIFLGSTPLGAIKKMRGKPEDYNLELLEILAKGPLHAGKNKIRKLKLNQLLLGMVLNQDLRAKNGLLLARKGQEVTTTLKARLVNFAKTIGIEEPFEVVIR